MRRAGKSAFIPALLSVQGWDDMSLEELDRQVFGGRKATRTAIDEAGRWALQGRLDTAAGCAIACLYVPTAQVKDPPLSLPQTTD